jgi:hypothetical protein
VVASDLVAPAVRMSDSEPRGERVDETGDSMKSLGGWLFIFGAGSFLLHVFNMEFRLLSWVDNWGPTTGIAIRVGLMVVGAALWLVGRKQEAAAPTEG